MDMKTDKRLELLSHWVSQLDGLADARAVPASEDASFRRYFRVGNGRSYIVMDAPPPQEDCRPFVAIAGFLEQMGLNSPRVLAADLEQGFLLLTDLGSVQYLSEMKAHPDRADDLYRDALDALVLMQANGVRFQAELPPYDEALLRFELSLFHDWLCEKHLGIGFSEEDEEDWRKCCDALVDCALSQPSVFVHRDFHSRNLMVTAGDNPGIIDFQDAVEGPYTYDLVSLLRDCYVKWPKDAVAARARHYFERIPVTLDEPSRFQRDFDLMGVQRHLKAAGIFARLLHRDGKPGYLGEVPRTLGYIVELAPDYAELDFLGELIRTRVLPGLKEAPPCPR
jgi:aminoglycoside/choline kinase family phosphotransferase